MKIVYSSTIFVRYCNDLGVRFENASIFYLNPYFIYYAHISYYQFQFGKMILAIDYQM